MLRLEREEEIDLVDRDSCVADYGIPDWGDCLTKAMETWRNMGYLEEKKERKLQKDWVCGSGWRRGVTMLKSGQVGRQSALRVLFATLRNVDSFLRAAEFQTRPMPQPCQAPHGSTANPGTFTTCCLFVLFLQFQIPAPPGKILFIVLSCVLDSSELLFYSTWHGCTLCHQSPLKNVVWINPYILLFRGL